MEHWKSNKAHCNRSHIKPLLILLRQLNTGLKNNSGFRTVNPSVRYNVRLIPLLPWNLKTCITCSESLWIWLKVFLQTILEIFLDAIENEWHWQPMPHDGATVLVKSISKSIAPTATAASSSGGSLGKNGAK